MYLQVVYAERLRTRQQCVDVHFYSVAFCVVNAAKNLGIGSTQPSFATNKK